MNETPPLQPDEERLTLREIVRHAMESVKPRHYLWTRQNDQELDNAVAGLEAREQAARIVSRFEVIDHTESGTGRQFVKWLSYDFKVEYSLQDDGRTLKVFLTDTPSNRKED